MILKIFTFDIKILIDSIVYLGNNGIIEKMVKHNKIIV